MAEPTVLELRTRVNSKLRGYPTQLCIILRTWLDGEAADWGGNELGSGAQPLLVTTLQINIHSIVTACTHALSQEGGGGGGAAPQSLYGGRIGS